MPLTSSRALRLHRYGEPLDVLDLEQVEVGDPPPGGVRVQVLAAGLNPADWELCRGFMPTALPRGIGYDVAGIVEAVGEPEGTSGAGTTGSAGEELAGASRTVEVGDLVVGAADLLHPGSCGAADLAVLIHWSPVPAGLDPVQAATLPMVVQTAVWTLQVMGVGSGSRLLVHGAGGMVGFAAVQVAVRSGARVIATAGPTFSDDLRTLGASVTAYGEGMVARAQELLGGEDLDLVLDTSRPGPGALPPLVALAGGDPRRVMTISNHGEARALGARVNLDELRPGLTPLPDLLEQYAALAAFGRFRLPVAATFPLDQWRKAVELSTGGAPHGKVVLLPG